MAEVVRRLVAGRGRVKVLEVGAGTGGTSAFVLAALEPYQERVEYHYTDVSPAMVAYGKTTYGRYGFARFATLDVEAEAKAHERGQYDVIVGSNVLHATRRMEETLANLKARLKGNGALVVGEMVEASSFTTATFGLLEGWWRFADGERRQYGPLLSESGWRQVLEEGGYRSGIYRLRVGLASAVLVAVSPL